MNVNVNVQGISLTLAVGSKKLKVIIKNFRTDFVVNVLRTTQFIRRIRSIDIVSLQGNFRYCP